MTRPEPVATARWQPMEDQPVRLLIDVDAERCEPPIEASRLIERGTIGTVCAKRGDWYTVEFDPDGDGGGWEAEVLAKHIEVAP